MGRAALNRSHENKYKRSIERKKKFRFDLFLVLTKFEKNFNLRRAEKSLVDLTFCPWLDKTKQKTKTRNDHTTVGGLENPLLNAYLLDAKSPLVLTISASLF